MPADPFPPPIGRVAADGDPPYRLTQRATAPQGPPFEGLGERHWAGAAGTSTLSMTWMMPFEARIEAMTFASSTMS